MTYAIRYQQKTKVGYVPAVKGNCFTKLTCVFALSILATNTFLQGLALIAVAGITSRLCCLMSSLDKSKAMWCLKAIWSIFASQQGLNNIRPKTNLSPSSPRCLKSNMQFGFITDWPHQFLFVQHIGIVGVAYLSIYNLCFSQNNYSDNIYSQFSVHNKLFY